jgi:hypothetical protein
MEERLPRDDKRIAMIEDMLAAIDAADEAARIVALRATRSEDLVEADHIRTKLALLWHFFAAERQRYRRISDMPEGR